MSTSSISALPPLPLPSGIVENQLNSNEAGLSFHTLEAGYTADKTRPLILLIHGFPELAYSWRKIMLPLANAGYYVVAVDQRGYGRTTGWDNSPFEKTDLSTFSPTTLVRDMVILVHALGYRRVKCIVGHDFGSVTASLCALTRPDFFDNVVTMSHPFKGSPILPFDTAHSNEPEPTDGRGKQDIHRELASLPEPRKHYKWYYSTAQANNDLWKPKEDPRSFLRGYFHLKSADWQGNKPHPLKAWTAEELAKMPYYYIMPLESGMREAVAKDMASAKDVHKISRWLPDNELDVYAQEYARTGYQGGLNWYRVQTDPRRMRDLQMFAGKRIEVPALYICGTKDWGTYQEPGVIEKMSEVCAQFKGVKMIDHAGHWVQQEQPEMVVNEIVDFLGEVASHRHL
ncbi:MAG: hypothetical protein M1812_004708 [Candelaria pacifica]|nr:MAG: hypothetical protein M1812_004708 [Candelaria pacifica]